MPRSCVMPGCTNDHFADGYCGSHYKRKWRYGDPLAGGPPRRLPLADRMLWHYTPGQPDECWEWQGTIDALGYGVAIVNSHNRRAHRVVYALHAGLGGEDFPELDHLCRNKRCVNPAHLEPVSHSENLRRHYAVTVTACPHGHVYDQTNTYLTPQGVRRCRECMRQQQRRRRARG